MGILELLILLLVLSWLFGFGFALAGELIHILIVVAVILLFYRLLGSRE